MAATSNIDFGKQIILHTNSIKLSPHPKPACACPGAAVAPPLPPRESLHHPSQGAEVASWVRCAHSAPNPGHTVGLGSSGRHSGSKRAPERPILWKETGGGNGTPSKQDKQKSPTPTFPLSCLNRLAVFEQHIAFNCEFIECLTTGDPQDDDDHNSQ